MAKFSVQSWQELSVVKKREHSLNNCKECHLDHSSTQALFPVNSPHLKGKGKENPRLLAKQLAKKVKHARKGAVEVTKEIYSQLNTEALCYILEAEVEKKTNLEMNGTQNVASEIVTAVSFIQNLPQTVESLKIILTLVISIRILLECRIAVNSLKSCITRMHLALVLH